MQDGAQISTQNNQSESANSDPERAVREILADPVQRRAILDWVSFSLILDRCILPSKFKLDDMWIKPLKFTKLGEEVIAGVSAQRRSLRDADVKLGVALQIGGYDGLFISDQVDTDAMRRLVSGELRKQNIFLPYIFGRELHDVAARDLPAKESLTNRETVGILKQLPIGVFQSGWSVTGPFGCLESVQFRSLDPSFFVPGYHCDVASCSKVHSIRIRTADTSVNRARGRVVDYIAGDSGNKASGARLVREAMLEDAQAFGFSHSGALFDTLADGFTEDETRHICERLLRRYFREGGENQKTLSKQLSTVIKDPGEFAAGLDRAAMLQIMLTFDNRRVIAAVDDATLDGTLNLSPFERRTRKNSRFSDPKTRVEVGSLGLRFVGPGSQGYVGKKLLALLSDIYFTSGVKTAEDLAYQLGDAAGGAEAEALLDRAVRTLPPARIIQDLVLADRLAAARAAEFLEFDPADRTHSRTGLHDILVWKLGLPAPVAFGDLQQIERFEEAVLSGAGREVVDPTELRGDISNLFTSLEDALYRSLVFSLWALTTDHFLAETGFEFDPAFNSETLSFIETFAPISDDRQTIVRTGRSTLVPLAAGFSRLAAGLLATEASESARDFSEYPAACRLNSQPFAFPYRIQFHNLSPSSQEGVIAALRHASKTVQDESVIGVRNATLHGNNEFPALADVTLAVHKIAAWRKLVFDSGLYPRVFDFVESQTDSFGQRRNIYRSAELDVPLQYPSWAVAPRMPSRSPRLLIMPIAETIASGPLRFEVNPRPGGDPYWKDYPRRWTVSSSYGRVGGGSDSTTDIDSAVLPASGQ